MTRALSAVLARRNILSFQAFSGRLSMMIPRNLNTVRRYGMTYMQNATSEDLPIDARCGMFTASTCRDSPRSENPPLTCSSFRFQDHTTVIRT